MSDVVFKLVADPTQFIAGVNAADKSQAALGNEVNQFGKDSKKAFDDAGKKADEFGKKTDDTTEKAKSLKAQYRELKAQLADATDPKEIERLAKAAGKLADQIGDATDAANVFATDSPFEAVGNAIGSVSSKLRNLDFKGAADQSKLMVSATKQITFKEALGGMKDLGTTLLNVGKSLLANPIFLVGAAIGLIIANFDELKNSGGLIGTVFNGISSAINSFIDNGKKLLQLIHLIGESSTSLEDVKARTDALIGIIGTKYDYEIAKAKKAKQEVVQLEIDKQKEIIKQLDILEKRTIEDFNKRLLNQKDFVEKARDIEKQRINANIAILNAETEAAQKAEDKKKAAKDKANEEYKKNLADFMASLLELSKKSETAELALLTGQDKITAQRTFNLESIDELQKSLEKKSKLAGKGGKLELEQLQQLLNLRNQAEAEYYNGSIQLAIQAAQQQATINQNKNNTALQNLEYENVIVKNGIDNIKAAKGASVNELAILEEQKNILLLKQELSYQIEKEGLVIKGIDNETKLKTSALNVELNSIKNNNDAVSKLRVEAINKELSDITQNSELAKAAAMTSAQNVINGIQEQLNKPKVKINLAKLLQLDDQEIATAINVRFNAHVNAGDIAAAKNAVSQLASSLKEMMSSYYDAEEKKLDKELEDNEKRIEARDANIMSLESSLNKEQGLQDKGLANNVDRIQEAIAAQKAAREKDLANETEIKDKKRQLAKEQLDIDTAVQASQLVLAIANLYGSLSGFVIGPVPVGLIVATAASVAMVSAFATQKADAYKSVKAEASYKDGVIDLQGPGTETSDSIKANLSKGESVMTAKETRKHKNLLLGIRNNDSAMIELGISELLKNTGVSLSNIPKELSEKRNEIKQAEYSMHFNSNNSGMEKRLDILNSKFDSLNGSIKDKKTLLPDGRLLIQKGNSTTYIKPKK